MITCSCFLSNVVLTIPLTLIHKKKMYKKTFFGLNKNDFQIPNFFDHPQIYVKLPVPVHNEINES